MKTVQKSIQKRLLRMIMLICGSLLMLTCVAFLIYEYITYRNVTKHELSTVAQITSANLTSSLAFTDKDDAKEILQALKAQKSIIAACVYDTSGQLFAYYPESMKPKDFPAKLESNGYVFKANSLEGFEPIIQNNLQLGTLYLKSDLKTLYSRFVLYGTLCAAFILFSFLFAWFLSKRMQGTIVKPILELAGKAKVISEKKDYAVRAQKKTDDEIGTLTDAFNQMLAQIEKQNNAITTLNTTLEERIAIRTFELQEANAALKEQNDFIQTIIDSSIDLIAVFDQESRYVILNKKADGLYQMRREELIGRSVLEIFPSLEGSDFISKLKKAFEGEFVHDDSYKSLVSSSYFENFFIPLKNENEAVDRVLVIGHDITGIMLANEKLIQLNAELEKSNRDLEQFAYIASHDLQEPLRKIKTFSELSERNIEKQEILKRYLQKIGSSATRMTDLIKAVLNYSRLSHTEAEFTAVDLNAIVQNIKEDLELFIEEKQATVHVTPLPLVRAIPLQVNQLFLNLFTNSLKFTDRPPVITIDCTLVSAGDGEEQRLPRNDSTYVKISFRDNGIGFDQQYSDKVFSIFQRLHNRDEYSGTGIGLALCKKIVENHDGWITVSSIKNEGTTFYIYFPYDPTLQNTNRKSTTIETPEVNAR